LLGLDIARAESKSILFVMADKRLPAGVDDDHAAGLGEDLAATLITFVPRAPEIFHPAWPLCCRSRSDRSKRLGWRRRRRDWC
jgi:hypothetical protein